MFKYQITQTTYIAKLRHNITSTLPKIYSSLDDANRAANIMNMGSDISTFSIVEIK